MASTDLQVSDIAEMLRQQPEGLCWHLFPNGKKAGGHFVIGSVEGEAGKSLRVTLRGPKVGTWADYSRAPGEPGGKGDMLKLLQLALGLDIGGAVAEAKRWLQIESLDPNALERQRLRARHAQERSERDHAENVERKRRAAVALWATSSPLVPSSPPVKYLEGRGIDFGVLGRLPGAIRFKPDMEHPEKDREWRGPAMITRFNALDGTPAAAHITFLERLPDGRWVKLRGVETVKKIHSPAYWGAHIPLWKGAQAHRKLADIKPGTPVEVAEGIEDGLSYAMANPEARIVAAGTLGNIGQLVLPAQAGAMNILAQRDVKPEPIAALEAAIASQQKRAREDGSNRAVNCRWPGDGFNDWNDWLRDLRGVAA